MKTIIRISILALFILASCEKSADEPYILKFYGDAYEDIGYSVSILNDGYVIAGQFTDIKRSGNSIDSSNKNMAIIKTGWDGNVIWKKSAGGKFDDLGSKIYQVGDGSLICIGTFTDTISTTPGSKDILAVKISSTGVIEWQKSYGGAGNQTGIDVVKTSTGYMILGSTDVEKAAGADSLGNLAGKTDIMLLKINNNGDFLESFVYGYQGDDLGRVISWNADGSFMVYGTTDMSDPGQGNHNLIMIRINPAGYVTQTKIIGGTEDEYAGDMEVMPDGYLLVYNVLKEDGSQRVNIKKLKNDIFEAPYFTNRIPLFNSFASDSSAAVYSLSKYKSDSFVAAGQSGKGSSARMLIFEMDANGNLIKDHQIIKGSTGIQIAYDVASGDDGYIIAVGKNSYDVNSMITFLKFKF